MAPSHLQYSLVGFSYRNIGEAKWRCYRETNGLKNGKKSGDQLVQQVKDGQEAGVVVTSV